MILYSIQAFLKIVVWRSEAATKQKHVVGEAADEEKLRIESG
jgi:hypothetical protein